MLPALGFWLLWVDIRRGAGGCKYPQVGDSCNWLGTAPRDLEGSLESLESWVGISIPRASPAPLAACSPHARLGPRQVSSLLSPVTFTGWEVATQT